MGVILSRTSRLGRWTRDALHGLLLASGAGVVAYRVFMLDLATAEEPGPPPEGYAVRPATGADAARASDASVRERAHFDGPGALGFGVFRGDELVCLQWVWHGERYRRERGFWPLAGDEAKSVDLVTAAAERNKGLATLLKRHSAARLRERGFTRLYSRIWWSHDASMRVSRKAGWRQVAIVVEVTPARARRSLRLALRAGALPRLGLRERPAAPPQPAPSEDPGAPPRTPVASSRRT